MAGDEGEEKFPFPPTLDEKFPDLEVGRVEEGTGENPPPPTPGEVMDRADKPRVEIIISSGVDLRTKDVGLVGLIKLDPFPFPFPWLLILLLLLGIPSKEFMEC